MRLFIKGTDGVVGSFAQCLCGSPNLYQALSLSPIVVYYFQSFLFQESDHCHSSQEGCVQEGGRKPWHSINFVTAHDGFSLADLVSYNRKHNIANGEGDNDGESHNNSWNCGEVRLVFLVVHV